MARRKIEDDLKRAVGWLQKGDFVQARAIYRELQVTFPGDPRPRQALAEIDKFLGQPQVLNQPQITPDPPRAQADALIGLFNQGRFAEVVAQAEMLVQQFPGSFFLWNILGIGNAHCRRIDAAVGAFGKACELNPGLPDAHTNLGLALREQGNPDAAIGSYRRALALRPDLFAIQFELGNVLAMLGRLDEATTTYRQALSTKPDFVPAHVNLGNALKEQGRIDQAAASYHAALQYDPGFVDALYNLGRLREEQGLLDEAVTWYQQALTQRPDHLDALFNLGCVFQRQGALDAAIDTYRRALAIKPDFAKAHNNLGEVFKELGEVDQAAACYAQALAYDPGLASGHNNLGNVLYEQGNWEGAAARYAQALAIEPDLAVAHYNLGNVYVEQRQPEQAIAAYSRAMRIDPDYAEAETPLLFQQQHICDWHNHAALAAAAHRLARHDVALTPFSFLIMDDDAALQLQFSRKWAAAHYKQSALPLPATPAVRPDRLRIGYFSADFYDHATMFLMAGLLREHDRTRFEVYTYSYGQNRSGDWRDRTKDQVAQFHDVAGMPSRAIADLARSHALDIAIDLKGYTGGTRLDLFQYRLAPVQISYLGYPGSLGTDFIDYIVADRVVIPDDQRAHYSERVIYLPHSYQPNDNTRAIAETTTTRADFGLPDQGFVFCSFNGSYKISPREFDIWMRALGQVDGSVLWLFKSNRWCDANLRSEAAMRGIAPDRLIFAEPTDHAHHLARQKHADLFLDTFNVNAHTTASDALWAGLPVVTKAGRQFAARVAASVLTAVGLPELITRSDAEYEALIMDLANDPHRLAAIRATLATNRHNHPLFDTQRYTRHFEAGLQQAYDRTIAGNSADDILIAP